MTITTVKDWVATTAPSIELRDYQAEAWRKLWQQRSTHRKRALIHLATGLGKTSVAAVDALHYLKVENPGARVLFVSHMTDISTQAKHTFLHVNPKFTTAMFRGTVKDVDVTFATFQALYRKLDSIQPDYYDYIIWDEAHHIEAETFSAVRKHFTPQFELGLTATPERADGRDILNYFGKPLFVKSLADGIGEGWLSAVDYHIVFDEAIKEAMNNGFELNTLKEIRGLFSIRTRNEVISKEVLQRRHEIGMDHAKTIVFCQTISAAEEMAKLLGGEVYHSERKPEDRLDILQRFKNGKLQVICTVDMFNEGIDIPDAKLVVFLRSTSSRTIFEQQLGRGLRKAPGKDKVTVLDFVANVERINFVRELGRHTDRALRALTGDAPNGHGGRTDADYHGLPNKYFELSNFEFDDQAIELLKRYTTLKNVEYLTQEEVVAAYKVTPSIPKLAKAYGVTWNAVYKHLQKAGIDTGILVGRTITTEQFIDKYAELKSIKGTANHFKVDSSTVRNRLRKAGVDITPTNAKQFASPELIETFERLGTVRQTALEFGMSRESARSRLNNSGIDTSYKLKHPPISKQRIDNAYKASNGSIGVIVYYLKATWADVYKALDEHGYLTAERRPITSAMASAAYYKYGNATKAGKLLGCSSNYISKMSKDGRYIKKFKQQKVYSE